MNSQKEVNSEKILDKIYKFQLTLKSKISTVKTREEFKDRQKRSLLLP